LRDKHLGKYKRIVLKNTSNPLLLFLGGLGKKI
jgi:hypothetical protein